MRRVAVLVPLVFLGSLQLSGCAQRPALPVPPPPGGAYVSASAGAFFDQSVARADAPDQNIAAFAMQGGDRPVHAPDTVVVAAGSQGVVVSEDGGATWRVITTPLSVVSDVVALANGVIVAAGTDGTSQGYVLRTIDDGNSWETVLTIPVAVAGDGFRLPGFGSKPQPVTVISIAADPFEPDRVYAGTSLGSILIGEQSAKAWRTVHTLTTGQIYNTGPQPGLSVADIIPSPHTASEVLVITLDQQLFRVRDGEQTKLTISRQVDGDRAISVGQPLRVLDVKYVGGFPDALIAGVEDGAVISLDRGISWQRLPLPVDTIRQFNSVVVAVSPSNPSRMLVAVNAVVFRSEDAGATWNTFSLGLPTHVIRGLFISPDNAARVVAVTAPLPS